MSEQGIAEFVFEICPCEGKGYFTIHTTGGPFRITCPRSHVGIGGFLPGEPTTLYMPDPTENEDA